MNDINFTIECMHCDNGTQSIGPECSRPASDCCGGCFRDVECDECSGSGHLDLEITQDHMEIMLTDLYMDDPEKFMELYHKSL